VILEKFLEKSHTTTLHLFTQKSELNLMYIATLQACIHNKPRSV